MINYLTMVKNCPNKTEELMWRTVEQVSALLDEIATKHPDKAHQFLMRQYQLMYGNHFVEPFARESVSDMYHTATDGRMVRGEMIDPERAFAALVPTGNMDYYWDAYVGANAFLHDLARTNLSEEHIFDCAREFWFADDDFADGGKVLWYFTNK